MNQYKRPEMEIDPLKKPGQIVNPIPADMFVHDSLKTDRIEIKAAEYKPVHGGYPDA